MDILKSVRQAIAGEYKSCLDLELRDWTIDGHAGVAGPTWSYVDPVTLDKHEADVSRAFGLVADDGIASLLYVVPFTPEIPCDTIINRALALQSRLLPEAHYEPEDDLASKGDRYGPWTVAILWLVEERHKQAWNSQIVARRHSSGFAEEISNDVLEYTPDQLRIRLREHHFPQLLFQTRASLMRDGASVEKWLSVDEEIAKALDGFYDFFTSDGEREIADQIISRFDDARSKKAPPMETSNKPSIKKITIRDFRSIRHLELTMRPENERRAALAMVINGPNGSGKSTVFEALSIALTGTSGRQALFDGDPDVPRRERDYVAYALAPLGAAVTPEIRVNDGPNLCASGTQAVADDLASYDGCLLSQADTAKFALLDSAGLGAQVLSGYSRTAQDLRDFVEAGLSRSNSDWQNLLRSLGIRASVSKRETYVSKICEAAVRREFGAQSPGFDAALERVASFEGHLAVRARELARRWSAIAADQIREALIIRIAKASARGNEAAVTQELEQALARRNDVVAELSRWYEDVIRFSAPWKGEVQQIVQDLSSWHSWIDKTRGAPRTESNELDVMRADLGALAKRQQQVVSGGHDLRMAIDHVTAVAGFVTEWAKGHPRECPTCGVDHSEAGGIETVVNERLREMTRQREVLGKEFKDIEGKIADLRRKFESLGEIECPISMERRKDLQEMLVPLVGTRPLEEIILQSDELELLKRAVDAVVSIQPPPVVINAESVAQEAALKIVKGVEDADAKRAGPQRWIAVKRALDGRLGRIVEEHLPKTIERLWMELVSYLTAARWIMPERPKLKIEDQKGEQAVTVRLVAGDRQPLARYILNQSETHILGLAWFLLRYVTSCRFKSNMMVLDDPAQEMDQPTFRGLCRLLGKILRL